jgi:L-fuculose-phosphate aldolase
MLLHDIRTQVAETCRALRHNGLVVGTAGNVSVRVDDLVVISPSGVAYDSLTPELVGVHKLDSTPVDAPLKPSSEFPLHLEVYSRTDASTIVHTHGSSSTTLSTVVDEVPASHYYTGLFGGTIRVAPYATFGTTQLAENVAVALAGRMAALMGNHGAIAIGDTLDKAYERVEYLEYVCDVHIRALSTGLPIRTLPAAEVERVTRLLGSYGQDTNPSHSG